MTSHKTILNKNKRRAIILGLACGFSMGLAPQFASKALAQSSEAPAAQPRSVVEASRIAKQQQKQQRPNVKVYTNDSLSQVKGDISVVGPPPAVPDKNAPANTPDNQAAPDKGDKGLPDKGGAANPKQASANSAKEEAMWRGRFADARKALAEDTRELDVLQREFNLKQEQYYTNPNVALREQYSRADLDQTQSKIDAKKADVQKDNDTISDLMDNLRRAGGDPGWSREP